MDEGILNSLDEQNLVRNVQADDLNNNSLTNISHMTLNSEPTDDNHCAIKPYVESLSENDRKRRSLSPTLENQDIE